MANNSPTRLRWSGNVQCMWSWMMFEGQGHIKKTPKNPFGKYFINRAFRLMVCRYFEQSQCEDHTISFFDFFLPYIISHFLNFAQIGKNASMWVVMWEIKKFLPAGKFLSYKSSLDEILWNAFLPIVYSISRVIRDGHDLNDVHLLPFKSILYLCSCDFCDVRI